jgi:hypothetical protein
LSIKFKLATLWAVARATPARSIKDVFYETLVLMGRDVTLRRFATEVLGGSVDPLMLGDIEKGKRFPNEALVQRLAALREQVLLESRGQRVRRRGRHFVAQHTDERSP